MSGRSTGPSRPKKALIICLGAIGDVTRALPLAVRLKRAWPETELHWAIEPPSRTLVESHPALSRVIVFDRPRGFPAFLSFLKTLRAERYDLVLDLQRHFKSGVTSFATGCRRRIGFHRQNSRELNWLFNSEYAAPSEHFSSKVAQYQRFGDALGLEPLVPLDFGLQSSPGERQEMESLLQEEAARRGAVLAPPAQRGAFILGSTWESRFWLAERYVEVIRELSADGPFTGVLIGGKGEAEFAQRILSDAAGLAVVSLVERTSLRQLVPLFEQCGFAAGSDSGPMHIASAVGIPVISLWGSTSPRRSAPYGSEEYVLQSAIGCSPCYRKRCPGLGTLCMQDIPARAVIAHVQRLRHEGRLDRAGHPGRR